MGQAARLSLSFREELRLPDLDLHAAWRGCSVEHRRMSAATDYAFAFSGPRHYLALHDLVLRETRMLVDSLAPVEATDLRDRMTYVPAGCSVSGWAATTERTNSFTILYFDPADMTRETDGLFARGGDGAPMIYFDNRDLRATLLRLQALMLAGDPPDPILAETLAMLAAVEIGRLQSGSARLAGPPAPDAERGAVARVRAFVEDNLAADISLDDMAAVATLSRFHFLRVFKAATGETPHRYVMARRTERAKEMLRGTRLPLGEIADATGFKSAPRLVRSFREVTGTTPGSWRRGQA